MYQTRQSATKKLPIPRKGTKYVARASSHLQDSIPVVIAIRDILKLAKTNSEVKKMIVMGSLKINGRKVKDTRESIKLFNILEAGNSSYSLSILPTGKFTLKESKEKNSRVVKVQGKKILKNSIEQLNFLDGSNIIYPSKKIKIHDSLVLDFSNKLIKHISLNEAKKVFIIKGKYKGKEAEMKKIQDKKLILKTNDKEEIELPIQNIIAIWNKFLNQKKLKKKIQWGK